MLVLLLVPSICWAPPLDVCKSSGRRTSDAAILASAGVLCGVLIETNGAADATVVVWDNATTTGTAETDELFKMIVVGADYRGGVAYPLPIAASDGLYVDVTGAGAAYIIYYRTY